MYNNVSQCIPNLNYKKTPCIQSVSSRLESNEPEALNYFSKKVGQDWHATKFEWHDTKFACIPLLIIWYPFMGHSLKQS